MMTEPTPSALRREGRRDRRRNQVLDAARVRVRTDGFHAASMSRISAEAGMSTGHIYKYFDTKEDIMTALAERDFEEFVAHIPQREDDDGLSLDDLIARFLKDFPWPLEYDRATLALEVLAEATRNPKVAELVTRVDRFLRSSIREILAAALAGLTAEEVDVRVEIILVITRALVLHAGTHPDSDPQKIMSGCELALRGVLARPEAMPKVQEAHKERPRSKWRKHGHLGVAAPIRRRPSRSGG